MDFQSLIDKLLKRGQTEENVGSQEQRGDGGTSCYRPNMNRRSVTAKMPEDALTGQFTLEKLKALTRKQETGNYQAGAGGNQNTGSYMNMQNTGNYTGNMQFTANGQTGATGNMEEFHRGYTGSIPAVHSGFTGMDSLGDAALYYGTPGNGVDAAYGYGQGGMQQNNTAYGNGYGGNPGGFNTNGYNGGGFNPGGYNPGGYAPSVNGGANVPNNVTPMPLEHQNLDTHVERVMVLTSVNSCYNAICHMKNRETLILSLDTVGDKNDAERWKYLLQGAAFTLRCSVATLPGSGFMILVAPSTVTLLRDDDRGTRDLREESAMYQAAANAQGQGWQDGTDQMSRRARRADGNANWNTDTETASQNSYYMRRSASPDAYGGYGGYGSN